jgi:hypothetical protein
MDQAMTKAGSIWRCASSLSDWGFESSVLTDGDRAG